MISSVVVSMGTSLRCSHSCGPVLNADHGGKFRDHEFGRRAHANWMRRSSRMLNTASSLERAV